VKTSSLRVPLLVAASLSLWLPGGLLLSGCTRNNQGDEARLELPDGWRWERQAEGHPIGIGPMVDDIVPNVNVKTVQWEASPDIWIASNLLFAAETFTVVTNYPTKLVSQEDYSTANGLRGTKLVWHNQRFQKTLWHIQYVFHTNSMMQVLNFTFPESEGPAAKAKTDKTASTFRHF